MPMNTLISPWFAGRAILLTVVLFLTTFAGMQPAEASTQGQSARPPRDGSGSAAGRLERSGLIAYSEGRYDKAAQNFAEAIRASENNGASSARGHGQLLSNLAWLYHEQGRVTEADSLLRLALAIDQRAFRPGALPVAHRTQELGMLHHAQGRFQEAGQLLVQALSLYEKNSDADGREIAITQHQIGVNYHATGDLHRGELFIKRALAGLGRNTGDRRYWAASILDLAELYRSAHRDAEASQAYGRALREANALSSQDGTGNGLVFNSHSVLLRRIEAIRAADHRTKKSGEGKK